VETLAKEHEREHFCCAQAALDAFLKKYSNQYVKRKLGTTYVAVAKGEKRVLGYFTLAPSHFEFAHAAWVAALILPR
jgi:hypothetical protein